MLAITFGFSAHKFPIVKKALKRPLPRSSTPNCHWPHGWVIAGERARPGYRFRRRAENRFPN
jgi:hypothetical protein